MKTKIWKALQVLAATALLVALGTGTYTVVQYLKSSPRFEVKKVLVLGHKRVAETQVLATADIPQSPNVFSVDLEGIRERVETLQWVRYAIVKRVLPDTVTIKIIEREPVGLARIRGEIQQFDADAVMLDFDPASGVSLPVLDGLKPGDRDGNLHKVGIYRKVLADLQAQHDLSEIHINAVDEVSVVPMSDPLVVILGRDEFRPKWIEYLEFRTQIQELYPETAEFDLRFKGQKILRQRPDGRTEESVVWDEEKKSL